MLVLLMILTHQLFNNNYYFKHKIINKVIYDKHVQKQVNTDNNNNNCVHPF